MLMRFHGQTFHSVVFLPFLFDYDVVLTRDGGQLSCYDKSSSVKRYDLGIDLANGCQSFNIIVMRTFFKRSVSDSIIESARIDGASELRIFVQIVLPLAVPGIATISLFAALGYWNDWFNALLYIQDDKLVPLQYLLMKIKVIFNI